MVILIYFEWDINYRSATFINNKITCKTESQFPISFRVRLCLTQSYFCKTNSHKILYFLFPNYSFSGCFREKAFLQIVYKSVHIQLRFVDAVITLNILSCPMN